MARKLKTNSFAESTMIMYLAIIITKILGAIYMVPFKPLVGESSLFVYNCAYSIYSLFFDISTSGIPVAISMIISEYNTSERYRTKEKAYQLGRKIILGFSLVMFLILQLFARQIGSFYITDMKEGVSISDISWGVRIVSLSLLVVPILSIKRGYLQGHKLFSVSSMSQIIEQFVRVAVVLGGSFFIIKALHMSTNIGVYAALAGAGCGGLAAYLFVSKSIKDNGQIFITVSENETIESDRVLLRKIIYYSAMISIVSISQSIYSIIDMKLILVALKNLHFSDVAMQEVSNNVSLLVPKISTIITSLTLAMTNSIAPHIASAFTREDYSQVHHSLNQATELVASLSFPMAAGLIVLATPVYRMFYGNSLYGPGILQLSCIWAVRNGYSMVLNAALQSMNRGITVCISTLIAIVINIVCDLPLMYLFDFLRLPAYLGAITSSIVSVCVLLTMQFIALNNIVHYSFRNAMKPVVKLLFPLMIMTVSVIIIHFFWPVGANARRLVIFGQLLVFAAAGAVVYFTAGIATNSLTALMNSSLVSRILSKFRRKEN